MTRTVFVAAVILSDPHSLLYQARATWFTIAVETDHVGPPKGQCQ